MEIAPESTYRWPFVAVHVLIGHFEKDLGILRISRVDGLANGCADSDDFTFGKTLQRSQRLLQRKVNLQAHRLYLLFIRDAAQNDDEFIATQARDHIVGAQQVAHAQRDFGQGQVAMWYDATSAAGTVEDPAESTVAGRIGYAPAPVVATPSSGWLYSWSLAIPETSPRKEAAWKFMSWMTRSTGCSRSKVRRPVAKSRS